MSPSLAIAMVLLTFAKTKIRPAAGNNKVNLHKITQQNQMPVS